MKDFKIICVVCGKEHFVSQSNKKTKCCSRGCANTFRASKIERPKCSFCNKIVNRRLSHCYRNNGKDVFCNKQCEGLSKRNRTEYSCEICHTKFERVKSRIRNRFCSRKCADIGLREWRQKNLTPQYRSFGECSMLILLKRNFPQYSYIPNDRKQLNGFEIDIWIPELKTGIEYNGPHHFKPVYGDIIFKRTKWADKTKRIVARRKGIRIVDLDVTYSISYTHRRRVEKLFQELCQKLSLTPTTLNFTYDEVKLERSIKTNP